jgi:hypothetical protein
MWRIETLSVGRCSQSWFDQNLVLLCLWFVLSLSIVLAIVIVLAKNSKTGPQPAIVDRLFGGWPIGPIRFKNLLQSPHLGDTKLTCGRDAGHASAAIVLRAADGRMGSQ